MARRPAKAKAAKAKPAKVLEPLLGRRAPDQRWDRMPRELKARHRASLLEKLSRAGTAVYVRLRPARDRDNLVSPLVARLRGYLGEIETKGTLTFAPPDARYYDKWARRTYCEPEDMIVLRINPDAPDGPGLVAEVKAREAILLLRDDPEGFGYLVEEVHPTEAKRLAEQQQERFPELYAVDDEDVADDEDDADDDEPPPAATKVKPKAKAKPKAKRPATGEDDEVEDLDAPPPLPGELEA